MESRIFVKYSPIARSQLRAFIISCVQFWWVMKSRKLLTYPLKESKKSFITNEYFDPRRVVYLPVAYTRWSRGGSHPSSSAGRKCSRAFPTCTGILFWKTSHYRVRQRRIFFYNSIFYLLPTGNLNSDSYQ